MKKIYIDWIDLFVTLVSTVTLFSTADLVGRNGRGFGAGLLSD